MGNQEYKKDAGKIKLGLIPLEIVWAIGRVRTWATDNKYKDPESYRQVEIERYHDALLRHLYKYLENPDSVDEESGLNHLDHVACNVAFLCELRKKAEVK